MTSSTSNSISLIYAVSDYEDRNGLLVYLPSGEPGLNTINDKRDFMAIEMVDRKIKFLWNNGAGTASIIHNATIGKSDIFIRFSISKPKDYLFGSVFHLVSSSHLRRELKLCI